MAISSMSTAPSPLPYRGARIVISMGVSSSGKTVVGEAIARRLHAPFLDGDDYHPAANIEKMSAGIALTDDDRWPWLERLAKALHVAAEPKGVAAVPAPKAVKAAVKEKSATKPDTKTSAKPAAKAATKTAKPAQSSHTAHPPHPTHASHSAKPAKPAKKVGKR